MERVKLTNSMMKKLVAGNLEKFSDTEVPGLIVRVMTKTISFYFKKKHNGRCFEFCLGNYPDITVEEARQMALTKLGALANYQDVSVPVARKQPLVKEAIALWFEKQKYPKKVASAIKYFDCIAERKIADLTSDEVKRIFDSLKDSPSMANHAIGYLRTAINQLFRKLRMENPVPFLFDDITLYPTAPRLRVMREDEAPKILEAFKAKLDVAMYADQAAAILLMIYTGQRKGRVLALTTEQIDFENRIWHVPGNNIKLPVEHPLNDEAWGIIQRQVEKYTSGALFKWRKKQLQDCRKTMYTVCRECGIENLHIHDLRRSLGTWMLSSGASIAEVSKTLGHSSIRTTEQVYAHLLHGRGRDATSAAIAAMKSGKI
jgi:integrase